jgi:hypothetical protein
MARNEDPDMFQVEITFGTLKSNCAGGDLDTPKKKKQAKQRKLVSNILAPSMQENLIFSIPHGLLVIALRYKMLVAYDNLEELLAGQERHVLIKPEFHDKPIFLAATAKGESALNQPMSAVGLAEYLLLRGRYAGFGEDISFYAFRLRSATDLAAVLGNDAAGAIMSHDPEPNPGAILSQFRSLIPTQ